MKTEQNIKYNDCYTLSAQHLKKHDAYNEQQIMVPSAKAKLLKIFAARVPTPASTNLRLKVQPDPSYKWSKEEMNIQKDDSNERCQLHA